MRYKLKIEPKLTKVDYFNSVNHKAEYDINGNYIEYVSYFSSIATKYYYDANNILREIKPSTGISTTYDYSYDDDKIDTITKSNGNIEYVQKYIYDNDGNISEVIFNDDEGYVKFEYDGDIINVHESHGNISYSHQFIYQDGKFIKNNKTSEEFIYENGNLSEIIKNGELDIKYENETVKYLNYSDNNKKISRMYNEYMLYLK